MTPPVHPRIAVVHEWLLDYAGSERVLAEILRCFPQADLFTLMDHMPEAERAPLGGRRAATSFLQRLPGARSRLKHLGYLLPLMPLAIEQLDVTDYDLVISSSHAVAKGVIVSPNALHISYVHSPMRYAWDQQFVYLQGQAPGRIKGALLRLLLHRLRLWDHRSAAGVDRFIANSRFIARRILKAYRRDAQVIYPPVDTEFFQLGGERDERYLAVSRLMSYKRSDILLEAFAAMPERRLVIIGDGPELAALRAHAPENVQFTGRLPNEAVRQHMQSCRALVFPAVEDFGITPVEALACGMPVVALRRGGAAESVTGLDADAPTGVLFDDQSAAGLVRAIDLFETERHRISPQACRTQAERFSAARFRTELENFVARAWAEWRQRLI
jgi:glycosyltransferase involved in cell wall biosynthesis